MVNQSLFIMIIVNRFEQDLVKFADFTRLMVQSGDDIHQRSFLHFYSIINKKQ